MSEIDESIIKRIVDHKVELNKSFNVKSLSIFGSFCRGTAGPESDVDILVKYQNTPGLFAFLDLKKYLEDILGRPVDLVTEDALKKQFRERILSEAVHVT